MLLPRLYAIIIIIGGYLACKMIFKQWPLRKNQSEEETETVPGSIFMRILGFGIIIGQLIYIWIIFSKVFIIVDSISLIFLFVKIIFTGLIALMLYKNIKG